jgi:hypothetical protein
MNSAAAFLTSLVSFPPGSISSVLEARQLRGRRSEVRGQGSESSGQ